MTDPSTKLLRQLQSIFTKQTPKTPLFSKSVQEFFKKIHRIVVSADEHYTTRKYLIKETELLQKHGSHITKGTMYSSIPVPIRSLLDRYSSLEQTFEFTLKGDQYKVCMVYPIPSSTSSVYKKTTAMFREALCKIYLWLFVAHEFAPPECSQRMTIFLYFTSHVKKMADIQGEPLDEIHSNTAFTTTCSPSTEINIFREEEWFKVLIHETFHNLGLDFSSMDDSEANRFILGLFPIEADQGIRLYETYCETWANTMNCFVAAYMHSRSNRSFLHVFQLFSELVYWESRFSVFQCANVLRHYGLTYQHLVEINDPASKKLRDAYHENTYVLSYYIIKSVLLFHCNDFVEWCIANNTNTHVVEFHKTTGNILSYCNLIQSLYKNEDYLNSVRKVEPWFNKNKSSTLRMTLFG